MAQNSSISDSLAEKWNFLRQYDIIQKVININSPCYAIANEWWVNFECLVGIANMESDTLMGNPGPINNLPLLDLSKMYQELVHSKEEPGYPNSLDGNVLAEMNDWDNMSLKSELEYRNDFVIVSSQLWNFLQKYFKGGPQVEFIPEKEPKNPSLLPRKITCEDEAFLDRGLIVNMDLIKIYITKDQDFASSTPKYISPTITVENLLHCVCDDYFIPISQAVLLHKTKQNNLVELHDMSSTLEKTGIQEGSFLSVSRSTDSILGTPNAMKDEESSYKGRKYNTEDTKEDRDTGRNSNHRYHQNSGSKDGKQQDIEMKDFGNNGSNHKSNAPEPKDQANLEAFLLKSKQSSEREKIKLGFKTLDQIKANLANIQQEWNSYTNDELIKKD